MFCPKCGSEYREGFYRCADCEVDLVSALPDMSNSVREEPDPDTEMIPILTTANAGDIGIVKSILDDAAISYFFRGESLVYIRPEAEAVLFVLEEDSEQVMELLKDVKLTVFKHKGLFER